MNRRTLFRLAGAVSVATLIAACVPAETEPDIIDIASANDDFSTLVAAVSAAGLVDTLKGDGPFTVFAPTNAAFAALPTGTVESLLKPENKDQLIKVLTYHVVPGQLAPDRLAGTHQTLEGEKLVVTGSGEDFTVGAGSATVLCGNIPTANATVYVIDSVLMPGSMG